MSSRLKPHKKTQSEQTEEEQQQLLQFSNRPVHLQCPFCLQQTTSEIILKPQYTTFALCLLLFITLPFLLNLVSIVFAFQLTCVSKHRCSLCERELGSDGKFLYFLKDEVYSFQLGLRGGLILTKKIVAGIVLTLLILLVLFLKGVRLEKNLAFTPIHWDQFIQQCSLKKTDQADALYECKRKYISKTVLNWTGNIMRIRDNRYSLRRYYEHEVMLYIKMDPPEHTQEEPEIILSLDTLTAADYEKQLDLLHHGDQIRFNATIRSMASKGDAIRHMHLEGLERTGGNNKSVGYYLNNTEIGQIEGHQKQEKKLRKDNY